MFKVEDKPETGKVYSLYDLSKTGKWSQSVVKPEAMPKPDPERWKKQQAEMEAKQLQRTIEANDLKKKHPSLIPEGTTKYGGCVLAAKNIRIELKKAFPGIKFSVVTKSYSGGNSLDVDWTDGPAEKEINSIIGKYESGTFDGMTDCYNYEHSVFKDTFGQSRYVTAHRHFSDAMITRAIVQLTEEYGIKDLPDVEDFKNGLAKGTPLGHPNGNPVDYYWEWQSIIRRHLTEMLA